MKSSLLSSKQRETMKYSFLRVKTKIRSQIKYDCNNTIYAKSTKLCPKNDMTYFPFMLLSNTSTTAHKALDFIVTRAGCCKYFIFSIMSFFGYQSFAQLRAVQTSHRSVTAIHSAKDR
jgi:hypothetical protein